MKTIYKRQIIFTLIILLLFQGLFSACAKKESQDNSGIYGSVSELAPKIQGSISLFTTEVDTFNPLQTKNYYLTAFLGIVYEGLVVNDQEYNASPILADSWTSSNNNKKWTFNLSKGVKWHNGTNFSSSDVYNTVNFINSNNYSGPYQAFLANVSSVSKPDFYSVVFLLNSPDPCFVNKMIFPILASSDIKGINNNKPFKVNGTGPYKYRYVKGNTWTYERFSSWHMKNVLFAKYNQYPPFIKKILLKNYKSPAEALGGFLRGEIDVYLSSDYSAIKSINNGYNSYDTISNRFTMLVLNTEVGILKNQSFRKLLQTYINKSALIRECFDNNTIVENLPNIPAQFDKEYFNFDPASNGTLPTGINIKKLPPIELLVNIENSDRCRVADALQKKLGERGIKINVKKILFNQFTNRIDTKNYQIALVGFDTPSSPDFRFTLKYNKNDTLSHIMNSWANETDPNKRKLMYGKIIEVVADQVPIIGLYKYKSSILSNRRILGSLSSDARFPYNNIAECSVSY